jgi:uncharacterized protein (DUF302 family)
MEQNQLIIEKVRKWGFDKTVELLTAEAQRLNWMIPAIHDLQQSLAKSGKSVLAVKILEVCKPEYSGKILEKSDVRWASLMMPCRISIYLKEDEKTYIALMNGIEMAAGMPQRVRDVMIAASDEVTKIADAVI